jgi:hypothetical protein
MKPLSMQIDFYNFYTKHSCIWWGVLDTTLRDKKFLRLTKLTVVSSCTTTGFPPSNNKDPNDETEIFFENCIKTTIILFCVILDWTQFFCGPQIYIDVYSTYFSYRHTTETTTKQVFNYPYECDNII